MKTPLSSLRRLAFAGLATCALATLGAAHARAQAALTFGGGNGTPLFLILNAPVTYAITTAASNGNAPFFDFQGVGNAFQTNYANMSGTITFTINGGAAQTLTHLYSGYNSGSGVAATDAYIFGSEPGVAVGDTVVLRAGTLTTGGNFAGAPPASGSFPTFLFDANGTKLDAANGVSAAVPEPSTWAAVAAGAGLLGLTLRPRRRPVRLA